MKDENNKELQQVRDLDRQISNRGKLEKIKKTGSNIAQMPVNAVKSEIDENDDEGLQGQRKVQEVLRPMGDILGDMTDASRREEVLKRAEYAKRQGLAGDRFYRISDFDFDNVTVGDLKAYKALCKNPTLSDDEIMKIRSSDATRAGRNQGERKQIFQLKKSVAINCYEDNVREFAKSNPRLFTENQMEVINNENGLFEYTKKNQLKINQEIHQIYMQNMSEVGAFREMKFGRMKSEDIENFVFRKDKLKAELKRTSVFRPLDNKFEIGCYAAYDFACIDEALREIGVGGKRTHVLRGGFDTLVGKNISNSELGQNYRIIKNSVKAGEIAVKTGVKMAELGYSAGHVAVDEIGKGITKQLDAAGNHEMAERLRKVGKTYVESEKKIGEGVRYVKDAPRTMTNKAIEKIKQSKTAKEIREMKKEFMRTKAGQRLSKMNEVFKKIKHAAMTPLRFIGKVMDVIKKKILLPVAVGIGILVLILILLSSLAGLSGGAGATTLLILDSDEHFKDFQTKYDDCDTSFISQVDSIINGYAQTTNKKGQQIKYGVNGAANSEGNENGDYRSGVTLNYFVDGAPSEGISSNIEDCLSVLAVIMQQQQEEYHEEALELLDALYKSSHTYNYTESALYPCESGCEITHYFCNQIKPEDGITYWGTEMKFSPWLYEELIKPTSEQECIVCKKDGLKYEEYAGCSVTGTCYHGDEDGNMGRRVESGCNNYSPVWDCDHDCSDEDCSHDCSGSDIGCAGYWQCDGHNHYGCPDGHDTKTCFGHVDITMNVNISSMDRLLEMGGVGE